MKRRSSLQLAVLWLITLSGPIVTLMHFEAIPWGPHEGWHTATLDGDSYLSLWTRRRLALWGALFVIGSGLLWLGYRRDSEGEKLTRLLDSHTGAAVLPFVSTMLLAALVFLAPAEVVLLWMMLLVVFAVLWVAAPSGDALTALAARTMLSLTVIGLLLGIGEAALRLPPVLRQTGGPLPVQAQLLAQHDRELAADPFLVRSRHPREPKPADVTRILAIGDSFTFGQWVADPSDTWPNVLEDVLVDHATTQTPVEVTNAGQSGTNTERHAQWLKANQASIEPDIVILQFTLNDTGYSPFRSARQLLPLFGSSLTKSSSLYHYVNTIFMALAAGSESGGGYNPGFEPSSKLWQACQNRLIEMRDLTESRGIPFLIVLYPMFDTMLDDANYRHLPAHRVVADFATEAHIPLLDIRPLLAELNSDGRAWWAQPFDAHPNAATHRVAGTAIAEWLSRSGMLPS